MIQHFSEYAKEQLLEFFNLSWTTRNLPTIWKTSIIIPILKPNKNASDCKSYRPISLTSTLCKLMERMIHSRLMSWLIEHKKLHFYQTAYQANHSTTDQLFYFCQSTIDGFQEKPPLKTSAVFLDLSAAFDRVWRQKLVHTIHNVGIEGNALIWINDFLRNRRFTVRVNGTQSKTHKSWAGVPQGSVLSPLLFLLYMNTIDSHIQPDTKVACYADDIAIWNTNRNLKASEKALNRTLNSIASWADDMKLTINLSKTNFCIFSTDRKHRKNFSMNIKLNNVNIERVTHPKYLGVTLDPELRFTKHIENTSNTALRKLNILRKLCGTNWGSRSSTLRSTYCSVIRPVLEYSSPIWASASKSVLARLDTIQYRASKIIIGAVSSTNNTSAELESGLISLDSRRRLATVKHTNKLKSYDEGHISSRTFQSWRKSKRLNRSSTLHFDSDIRKDISLEHSSIDILPEPVLQLPPPNNTKIFLNLLHPCSKKEPISVLLQKGMDTINSYSHQNKVLFFTDGSSDNSFTNGGAGIFVSHPSGERTKLKIPTGKISSNFTSELIAIKQALSFYLLHYSSDLTEGLVIFSDSKSALEAISNGNSYLTQQINCFICRIKKSCILQWIPAHVGIDGNESADALAKAARKLDQPHSATSEDVTAVAKHRLFKQFFKKPSIPHLNCPRQLSSVIARLRTGHLKNMIIAPDNSRSYSTCKHCPSSQLSPEHIFNCPAITAAIFRLFGPLQRDDFLYSPQAPKLAELVLKTFGHI